MENRLFNKRFRNDYFQSFVHFRSFIILSPRGFSVFHLLIATNLDLITDEFSSFTSFISKNMLHECHNRSFQLLICFVLVSSMLNGPRSIWLDASQENWVECLKSRLSGKFSGGGGKTFLSLFDLFCLAFLFVLFLTPPTAPCRW